MADLKLTLEYDGDKLEVFDIDSDEELRITTTNEFTDPQSIYICDHQVQSLYAHLGLILERYQGFK